MPAMPRQATTPKPTRNKTEIPESRTAGQMAALFGISTVVQKSRALRASSFVQAAGLDVIHSTALAYQ